MFVNLLAVQYWDFVLKKRSICLFVNKTFFFVGKIFSESNILDKRLAPLGSGEHS